MDEKRKVIGGIPISSGIVLGTAYVMPQGRLQVTKTAIPASRINTETDALESAVEKVIVELRSMRESALHKAGGPVAKIFDAQLLIASDYEFLKEVKKQIRTRRHSAAYVYSSRVQKATAPLKASHDQYIRQMAIDIEAVAEKVLSHLGGWKSRPDRLAPNTVVINDIVTPNDVLAFRHLRSVGFVSGEGGTDSHMALIARAFMLPVVVVKRDWKQISDNCRIIVDGSAGQVIVNPSDEDWAEYQLRRKRLGPPLISRLRKLSAIPPVTADGCEVGIATNLTVPGPADDVLAARQIPVGLYRTEYLYITRGQFPNEDTQYQYYSQIAEKFAPTPVVLRTFDLGYDKLVSDKDWPTENNPALGWRGIRAMLDMSKIFKTQIRAMLRASKHRNLRIMLPMISDRFEIERARKFIAQEKLKLRRKHIDFDEDIQVGVMVEVPAAALTAEALAERADFISIGTNDLTQYTMAADRTNQRVAGLYSALHPSVLTLIGMTIDACRAKGVPVSVCGELAGDVLAAPLLIGLGVDMLSMSPNRIVDVCRIVKKIDSAEARRLVKPVMSSGSLGMVIDSLKGFQTAIAHKKRS